MDRTVLFAQWVIGTACQYEVVALASRGRLPTISQIQGRHRALGFAVLGVLGWHFAVFGKLPVITGIAVQGEHNDRDNIPRFRR